MADQKQGWHPSISPPGHEDAELPMKLEVGGEDDMAKKLGHGEVNAAKREDGSIEDQPMTTASHFEEIRNTFLNSQTNSEKIEALRKLPYFPQDNLNQWLCLLNSCDTEEANFAAEQATNSSTDITGTTEENHRDHKKQKPSKDEETVPEDSQENENNALRQRIEQLERQVQVERQLKRQIQVERQQIQVERQQIQVENKVMVDFLKVNDRLVEVDFALNEMARWSQAEASLSAVQELGEGTLQQASRERKKKRIRETGDTSEFVQTLLREQKDLDTSIFDPKAEVPSNDLDLLSIVAELFDEWISKSTILTGIQKMSTDQHLANNKKDYKSKIESSTKWFLQNVRNKLESSDPDAKGENNTTETVPQQLYFPGLFGDEVSGCQPVFVALIESISESLRRKKPTKATPKLKVNREATLLGSENRHYRKIDIVPTKEGKALLLMHDEDMRLSIEQMSFGRNSQSVESLMDEKRYQAVCHTAKAVDCAFNFCGVGTSGRATALSGFFAFLKVHHLKLTMQARDPCANLEYQESAFLPLMSRKSFMKVLCAPQKATDANLSKKQQDLLNLVDKGFTSETTIQSGMRLLFELIQKRKHNLLGFDIDDVACDTNKELLGTGTFGIVLGDKNEEEDSIWKVETVMWSDHFDNERKALNALKEDTNEQRNDGQCNLPQLLAEEVFKVKLGCNEYSLRCLKLSPKGIPVVSMEQMENDLLITASKQVSAGMHFLHKKGFVHGDISPKNIVVCHTQTIGENDYRFILVDLGLATELGKNDIQLSGLQGTLPYIANSIFSQYPNNAWHPQTAHDVESLQYTMAALLNGGIPTWIMTPFLQSAMKGNKDLNTMIENREKAVNDLFVQNSVKWNEDKAILERCNPEQGTMVMMKLCKK